MNIEQTIFEEQIFSAFNFEATATAHGWVALRPFEWDAESRILGRIQQLSEGQVVRLRMSHNPTKPQSD